jgi:GNAT superfamily N-acetyltransferase
LDDWLKSDSLQSESNHSARTYVVCAAGTVVGFYCIATASVERRALPSKMRRVQGQPNQTPVAVIGRLARHEDAQWKRLGADLLQDALTRIADASETIGIRAVLVHAIDDEAASFWRKHEFIECPIGSRTFYLPIETILDGFSE